MSGSGCLKPAASVFSTQTRIFRFQEMLQTKGESPTSIICRVTKGILPGCFIAVNVNSFDRSITDVYQPNWLPSGSASN